MRVPTRARRVIRDVVVAQSNAHIKALLLSRDIHGGATKSDFQQRLEDAVAGHKIDYDELTSWIDETEGWGDEHVYLYKVSSDIDRLLSDEQYAESRVRATKFAAAWKADASNKFPAHRRLTTVQWKRGELTFVWHEGMEAEKRVESHDFRRREVDGEYQYKAWRISHRRTVTRIVIQSHVAAVFFPSRLEPEKHLAERLKLFNEIAEVVDMRGWPVYSMEDAIKVLDENAQHPSRKAAIRAQNTKLAAQGGGYVEFASDTDMSYGDIASLHQVRGAVQLADFRGAGGEFRFSIRPERDVKVHLYGDADRIRMWMHLTRDDVWAILADIPKRRTRWVPTGTP